MRLSAHKNDPGYSRIARKAKAFLNGEMVDGCFTADEEMGKVWRYIKTRKGKCVLNPQKNGILTKCLSGQVEIRIN